MVKGYTFPVDALSLKNALETHLPGVALEITPYMYGTKYETFPSYLPRTGYGRRALEKTENENEANIVCCYEIRGSYSNRASFRFRVWRNIDVEDLAADEKQKQNLRSVGNMGTDWTTLSGGKTSYSCLFTDIRGDRWTVSIGLVAKRTVSVLSSIFAVSEEGLNMFFRDEAYRAEKLENDYPEGDYTLPPRCPVDSSVFLPKKKDVEPDPETRKEAGPLDYPVLMKTLTDTINIVVSKNTQLEEERARSDFELMTLRESVQQQELQSERVITERIREAEESATTLAFASFQEQEAISRQEHAALLMEKDLAIKALMESNERLRQKEEELCLERTILQARNLELHKANVSLHEAQELNKKWSEWYSSRFPSTTTS